MIIKHSIQSSKEGRFHDPQQWTTISTSPNQNQCPTTRGNLKANCSRAKARVPVRSVKRQKDKTSPPLKTRRRRPWSLVLQSTAAARKTFVPLISLILLISLFPDGSDCQSCPPSVQSPCTCVTDIYEPVSIVCDSAASLAQALTSIGTPTVVIDSLTFINTPIPRLQAFAFKGYAVKRLILERNGLQGIDERAFEGQISESLVEVEIRDNKLGQIPITGLPTLKKLKTLVLSQNGITSVGPNTFSRYSSNGNIRKLDLTMNRIVSIDPSAFIDLTGIQEIGLDKNFLQSIPTAALASLPTLEDLAIGVNKLSDIPVGSLQFPNLKSLSLIVNQIRNISGEAFQGVPNLLYLYLSDNQFSIVDSQMFRFVPNLKVLTMGNNQISDINQNSFQFVPGLIRLEMSECGIENIDPGAFQSIPGIQVIVLNKNKLKRIPRNMFQGMKDLISLDLKSNEISVVEDRCFSMLPALKHLDLSSNQVQTIFAGTYDGTFIRSRPPTTRVLYTYDNPWNCDQRLDWFRVWLRNNSDMMIDAPGSFILHAHCYPYTVCSMPEYLRGNALLQDDPPKPTDFASLNGTVGNFSTSDGESGDGGEGADNNNSSYTSYDDQEDSMDENKKNKGGNSSDSASVPPTKGGQTSSGVVGGGTDDKKTSNEPAAASSGGSGGTQKNEPEDVNNGPPVDSSESRSTTPSPVQKPLQGDGADVAGNGGIANANIAAITLGIILGILLLSVLLLMVVRYFVGKNRRDRKEEERWMRDGSSSVSAGGVGGGSAGGNYAFPSPPPPDSLTGSQRSLDFMIRSPKTHPGAQMGGPQQGYFLNRPWYYWF